MCHILWHIGFMPSINLRELRNTRQLKSWLRAGESVELRERNQVLARIVPTTGAARGELPDFAARTPAIFGARRLRGSKLLLQERKGSRY